MLKIFDFSKIFFFIVDAVAIISTTTIDSVIIIFYGCDNVHVAKGSSYRSMRGAVFITDTTSLRSSITRRRGAAHREINNQSLRYDVSSPTTPNTNT
mmetsp:Transcript_13700/g.19517  ORF Transcript_13700/g.19517 Transcript_13700/m.19517 type:complete len:97 (-) Transcript_13700:39-329(-)